MADTQMQDFGLTYIGSFLEAMKRVLLLIKFKTTTPVGISIKEWKEPAASEYKYNDTFYNQTAWNEWHQRILKEMWRIWLVESQSPFVNLYSSYLNAIHKQ